MKESRYLFFGSLCARHLWIVIVVLIAGVVYSSEPAGELPFEHASKGKALINEILTQKSDLRELYSDRSVLLDRIRRSVVALEVRAVPAGVTRDIPSGERPIKGRQRLRDFLDSVGLKAWRGGQPQVKIIKQNCIIQSPLFGSGVEENPETFLTTRLEPGDLIILTRIP